MLVVSFYVKSIFFLVITSIHFITSIPAVTCGGFDGRSYTKASIPSVAVGKTEVELGSTIIYVPTRKETLSIAKYLCRCGVKAAAYNAKVYFCCSLS